MPGSLRLHCVHLCRAPALDLAGPELRAVVDAAASEDPCESGAAIAGCMPSPSPLPLSPSGMPPNTHRDPAGGGKGQAGPGRWTGGPVLLRAPPASPPQPWTGRNGGDDLSLPSSEPLHGGDPFTAETPSRGDPFTRRPLHPETPSRGDSFTWRPLHRRDPFTWRPLRCRLFPASEPWLLLLLLPRMPFSKPPAKSCLFFRAHLK